MKSKVYIRAFQPLSLFSAPPSTAVTCYTKMQVKSFDIMARRWSWECWLLKYKRKMCNNENYLEKKRQKRMVRKTWTFYSGLFEPSKVPSFDYTRSLKSFRVFVLASDISLRNYTYTLVIENWNRMVHLNLPTLWYCEISVTGICKADDSH